MTPLADRYRRRGRGHLSLFWRISLLNGAVLTVAGLVLALSPATVSFPIAADEAVVLLGGLLSTLAASLFLARRAFAPLGQLAAFMRRLDAGDRQARVPDFGRDAEVVALSRAVNGLLDRLESERRQSVRRTLEAQEVERRRIARELHDEVGQSLTAVVLQLERAGRHADGLHEDLAEARETARASLEDVRLIAQRLRPEALEDLGLPAAVSSLAERLSDATGVAIGRHVDPDLPALGPDAELAVYRIAQEGLTNALRHASPSELALTLESDSDGVVLQIADDGPGIDGAQPGMGVQGMRERALLVDGKLRLTTRREGGTELRFALPIGAGE